MRNSKYLCVFAVAVLTLVGACGKESGDGLLTVDTVPPLPPVNVSVEMNNDVVTITWDENAETDLAGYRLYKSSSRSESYEAVTSSLLYCPWYHDELASRITTYYKATALDQSGNESAFSQAVALRFDSSGNEKYMVFPDNFSE